MSPLAGTLSPILTPGDHSLLLHLAVDTATTLHHVACHLQVVVHHGLHQWCPLLLVHRIDVGSSLRGGAGGLALGRGWAGERVQDLVNEAEGWALLTCSSTWQISTEPFWAAACKGVRLLCWSLWKLGSRLSTAWRARHTRRGRDKW